MSRSCRRAGAGWKTTSTPAATAPTAGSSWDSLTPRWRRCCAPLPMTGPGRRCAASWAGGSSSGSGTARRPTGTPWPSPAPGTTAGAVLSPPTATATCPASSCASATAAWATKSGPRHLTSWRRPVSRTIRRRPITGPTSNPYNEKFSLARQYSHQPGTMVT